MTNRREFVGYLAALGALPTIHSLARVTHAADTLTLANDIISATWTLDGGRLRLRELRDVRGRTRLGLPEHAFALTLGDGSAVRSTDLVLADRSANIGTMAPQPSASRLAERLGGRQVSLRLTDPRGRFEATWRAELRDGSHYIRQEVTLRALNAPLPVKAITLVEATSPNARATGTVKGSPFAIDNWFLGFEHPLSENGSLARELPLRPESPVTVSSVAGIARAGQMRRDFLAYVERERAHPYRTFLHYNSWYDIAYFGKYSEAEAVGVIQRFGDELVTKRGVQLDSFLFDDGWDDPHTLWGFHSGFPNGFAPLRDAAAKYGAAAGIWFSPWGGYGDPKKQRVQFGTAEGFEIIDSGFALSGPKYYQRFHDTTLRLVRDFGINQFKIDGTGNASRAFPGSIFDSDFDAAIRLIDDIRVAKPDIFINLTTGTYPSPFWLRYADSIWRGGEDHDFAGVGTSRQQWITYRDAATYENTVQKGSLFPINSLMLHGMIYARHADKLDTDPGRDFPSEVRSYFGTGTHLQEMYVTPTLTQEYWDVIAERARWSRANADTLVDTHWIGGHPAKLEVYGWASLSPRKGIVTLRNPSDKAQRFELNLAQAFELPIDAARPSQNQRVIELAPFEVVTLEVS